MSRQFSLSCKMIFRNVLQDVGGKPAVLDESLFQFPLVVIVANLLFLFELPFCSELCSYNPLNCALGEQIEFRMREHSSKLGRNVFEVGLVSISRVKCLG